MLGKNNFNEKLNKIERQSKHDRFSIRKLTVGAASVLIGLSFVGLSSQTAKADTISPETDTAVVGENEVTVTSPDVKEKVVSSATNTETTSNETKNESKSNVTSYQGLKTFLKFSSNETNESVTPDSANITKQDDTTDKSKIQTDKSESQTDKANITMVADEINTSNVSTAEGFVTAMGSGDKHYVNLLGDVEIPHGFTDTWLNKLGEIGVKGDKIIDGQGHTLNLNDNQLSGNIIQSLGLPNITFKNITINGTGAYLTHLPIVNNIPWTTIGDFGKITLDKVITNGITFGGGLDSQLISVSVNVIGDSTINYKSNNKNSKNSTLFDGNLIVNDGVNLAVNAGNLVQLFNGELMNTINNLIPDISHVNNKDDLINAIKGIKLGSKFTIGKNANVNVYLDSTVTRLCENTLLNIEVNDGARLKLVDNAPAIKAELLDPLANWVFLSANNPASVKIISTNPDVKRPQIRYLGTDITGKNIGMSDMALRKNWVLTATHSNLMALALHKIPIASDIIDTILPQLNLTGLNETLVNDYQTPLSLISKKGKANKTFTDFGTMKDLENYCSFLNGPLFDASGVPILNKLEGGELAEKINRLLGIKTVPGLQLGTDLDDVLAKTGAGIYDVTSLKQTAKNGKVSLGKDILTINNSVDGTSSTIDALSNTKVITGVQWVPGKAMDNQGNVIDGGVIAAADGTIIDGAKDTDVSKQLGNAIVHVDYSDNTYDEVPVQVKVETATNGGTNGGTNNGGTNDGSNNGSTNGGTNNGGTNGGTNDGSTNGGANNGGTNGGSNNGGTNNGSTNGGANNGGTNGGTNNGGSNNGGANNGGTNNGGANNGSTNGGANNGGTNGGSNNGGANNGGDINKNSNGTDVTKVAVKKVIRHTAYVYDSNGTRLSKKYTSCTKVNTFGTKFIKGRKYYNLGNDKFIIATNIDGTLRKLKHNSYVYNNKIKRIKKKTIKKGKYIRTYGSAVRLTGKKYYIVGANKYVKKANF